MRTLLVLFSCILTVTGVRGDTFSTGATTNVVPGSMNVTGALTVQGNPVSTNSTVTTNFVLKTGSTMTGALVIDTTGAVGRIDTVGNDLFFYRTGNLAIRASDSGMTVGPLISLSNSDPSSPDVKLFRDGANILALRNSTTAQEFRIYNTFTDTSNYERAYGRWSGNVFTIGTEGAGTGTNRVMQIMFGTNVLSFSGTNLTWNGTAITVP